MNEYVWVLTPSPNWYVIVVDVRLSVNEGLIVKISGVPSVPAVYVIYEGGVIGVKNTNTTGVKPSGSE